MHEKFITSKGKKNYHNQTTKIENYNIEHIRVAVYMFTFYAFDINKKCLIYRKIIFNYAVSSLYIHCSHKMIIFSLNTQKCTIENCMSTPEIV